MRTVLHVLPALSRGGAARALLTTLAALADLRGAPRARLISLRPADPLMSARAAELGIPLTETPTGETLEDELARADVVQVDFWNSPELYELLRGPLPPARLVIWFHVGGAAAPQVITPELAGLADRPVASGPMTAEIDGLPELAYLPPVLDAGRIEGHQRREHEGHVVGYIGTVDEVKMHPRFVELAAAVASRDARFVVCGSGNGFAGIARDAERLGVRERFELRGYVEDVGAELAGFDVFGYPLCRENYSTSELVLQEAMLAGVPPVVLPHGGAGRVVDDGRTGIVADDERDYVRAVERLGEDGELRERLGEEARRHARRTWSAPAMAGRWSDLYADLLEQPKRRRSWPAPTPGSGAELFVGSLGPSAGPFRSSLEGRDPASAGEADAAIRGCPPVLARADGGVLDYRRRFPADPHLRLWSGLVLAAEGRPALAAGELSAALRLGIDRERAGPSLEAITGAER